MQLCFIRYRVQHNIKYSYMYTTGSLFASVRLSMQVFTVAILLSLSKAIVYLYQHTQIYTLWQSCTCMPQEKVAYCSTICLYLRPGVHYKQQYKHLFPDLTSQPLQILYMDLHETVLISCMQPRSLFCTAAASYYQNTDSHNFMALVVVC